MKIVEVKPMEIKAESRRDHIDETKKYLHAVGSKATRRFEVLGCWIKNGAKLAVAQAFNIKQGNAHPWMPTIACTKVNAKRTGLRRFEVMAIYGNQTTFTIAIYVP